MQVLRGICIFCFAEKGGGKIDTRQKDHDPFAAGCIPGHIG